jgi:DNA-binding transcriptional ArsR family regulator
MLVVFPCLPIADDVGADTTGHISVSPDKSLYLPNETVHLNAALSELVSDSYQLAWNKTMPGGLYQYSGRIATDDEYLYFIGTVQSGADTDVLLVKTDLDGNEVWNRTWGISDEDIPADLIVFNDTIYVVGTTDPGFVYSVFLLAFNESGGELWNRTFSGGLLDLGTGLAQLNGSLYLSGWTMSYGAGGIDALLLKFNLTQRKFEWYRTWGGSDDDHSEGITSLNGSLYMAVYNATATGYAGIVKYDTDGNVTWNRTWGPGWEGFSIASATGLVATSGSRNDGTNRTNFLRAYDESGSFQFEKTTGGTPATDSFSPVCVRDGKVFCAGTFNSSDVALAGYDVSANSTVLNTTWGGTDQDIAGGIAVLNNSDIYLGGRTNDKSSGSWNLFLLKYTKRVSSAGIPIQTTVKGPEGQYYFNRTVITDQVGRIEGNLSLPLDAPEGRYDCSVAADICGTRFMNSTAFEVVWPWSPVLTVLSSYLSEFVLPGDLIPVRAYTGYEYLPARASRIASFVNLTIDIIAPNGTSLATFHNLTGADGWTDLGFVVPKDCTAGAHTARITGFEGLSREIQFTVVLPVKQAPQMPDDTPYVPVTPIVGSAAIGLIALGIALSATETGKFAFFAPIAPLYTRIRRDKALSHRVRHQIIGYLADNPGQHYNGLKRALRLSNSVMVYHLIVLEREGFIKSLRDGTMKRFYPASVKTPDVRKRTPEELDSEILAVVQQRPGMTHKDLMEHLVVGNDVVKYHTRKLVRARRLLSSKDGKTRKYYPHDSESARSSKEDP